MSGVQVDHHHYDYCVDGDQVYHHYDDDSVYNHHNIRSMKRGQGPR